MIHPKIDSQFTMKDLKKSKMAGLFFDMIFNLNKFALYEQRDPFLLEEIRSTPQMSDWDRFASSEYLRYAAEDDSDESDTNTITVSQDIDKDDIDHEMNDDMDSNAMQQD